MPVGAGWIWGGIEKCVLNWGLCGCGRSRGAFHFWVFCSFTTWSCITLCVDFKWLNKLVVFPWGADTVAWHILHDIFVCFDSDYSKLKCFNTTELALPFFPTKVKIFRWMLEMEGFATFTTKDTVCGKMIILLWLSCFYDRGKPKSKLKLKFN